MELRFAKSDLPLIKRLLGIPEKITCQQETTCSGIEGLCIFLKRLAYPCRYSDMAIRFGRNPSEICLIFNEVLDLVGINLFCHHICYKIVLMYPNCSTCNISVCCSLYISISSLLLFCSISFSFLPHSILPFNHSSISPELLLFFICSSPS